MEKNEIIEQQQQRVEEMFDIRWLNDENAVFSPTKGGFVSMKTEQEEYTSVRFYRAFPFSHSQEYISVRSGDGNDSRELGMIRSLSELSEQTRALIERQLELRYFMPVITKILEIRQEYGYAYWTTETDRGQCRFTVALGGNGIARLSETHLIVSDISGSRFEIPNIASLSAAEQKKLDLYL